MGRGADSRRCDGVTAKGNRCTHGATVTVGHSHFCRMHAPCAPTEEPREYRTRKHGKHCPACYDLPHRRAQPVCVKCGEPYEPEVLLLLDED